MTDLEEELDDRLLEVSLEWELGGSGPGVRGEEVAAALRVRRRRTGTAVLVAAAAGLLGLGLWWWLGERGTTVAPASPVILCEEAPDLPAAQVRGQEQRCPIVCLLHAGPGDGDRPAALRGRLERALEPHRDQLPAGAGVILTHIDIAGRPELGEYYGLERLDGAILLLEPYRYVDKWAREHESAILGRFEAGATDLGSFLLAGLRAWEDRRACRTRLQKAWEALRSQDQAAFEELLWPPLLVVRGREDLDRMFASLTGWASLADRYTITAFAPGPLTEAILARDPAATACYRVDMTLRVERGGVAATVGTSVDLVRRDTASGSTFWTIWNE